MKKRIAMLSFFMVGGGGGGGGEFELTRIDEILILVLVSIIVIMKETCI